MSLILFGGELRRMMRLARSYWVDYLSDFILYGLGFLLLIMIFRAASEDYGPEGMLSTLIGFIAWKIGATAAVDMADIAAEEAKTGTLEQVYLSSRRLWSVFLGRCLGLYLDYGLRSLFLGGILAALVGVLRPISFTTLVVFILMLASSAGLGFALTGLVLIYKRVGGILNLIWQVLVFFTGALAPIHDPVLSPISRALPLTWGIEALRAIMVNGDNLTALWQNGLIVGLLVNTTTYIVLGIVIFSWGQKQARALGVLAHY